MNILNFMLADDIGYVKLLFSSLHPCIHCFDSHCMLCRDYSYTFASFQTVTQQDFLSVLFTFSVLGKPTSFYNLLGKLIFKFFKVPEVYQMRLESQPVL